MPVSPLESPRGTVVAGDDDRPAEIERVCVPDQVALAQASLHHAIEAPARRMHPPRWEHRMRRAGKDASSPRRMASTTGMQSCRAYCVAKVSNASSGSGGLDDRGSRSGLRGWRWRQLRCRSRRRRRGDPMPPSSAKRWLVVSLTSALASVAAPDSPAPQRSLNTEPGATEESWAASPSRTRRASLGSSARSRAINLRSSIEHEHSSTMRVSRRASRPRPSSANAPCSPPARTLRAPALAP